MSYNHGRLRFVLGARWTTTRPPNDFNGGSIAGWVGFGGGFEPPSRRVRSGGGGGGGGRGCAAAATTGVFFFGSLTFTRVKDLEGIETKMMVVLLLLLLVMVLLLLVMVMRVRVVKL